MSFDVEKNQTTTFKDRVEDVPVPRLQAFFGEKDKPVWTVKGLTGEESAIAKQAVAANKNLEAVLEAVGSSLKKDKVAGIKELAGISDRAPDELVQRFSWLVNGSVDPVCDEELAKKMAQNFPEDFYLLTNKILQLTGQGRLGELPGSGKSQ